MALSKIVKINDKLSWALWKIDADWQELFCLKDFSADEEAALLAISHPQKKAEYLATRLALHALLDSIGIRQYKLFKDEYGKPHIRNHALHISLANSYPYAVAVIGREPVGIDIEKPSEKLLRVQHKFLHESEYADFYGQAEKLCLAWCAKESLYKLYGKKYLSFKEHIMIKRLYYPTQAMLEAAIILPSQILFYKLAIYQEENFFILLNV
ncbi:MAG: 4'-phosphopantetheinyl transferase family protein [Cyclobacteriaceae bacterium]